MSFEGTEAGSSGRREAMAEKSLPALANGCKYVRKDGLMGWERRDDRWFTAVPGGRPQGSPCPYMDDLTIASLIADGPNTNWELIQPEAT